MTSFITERHMLSVLLGLMLYDASMDAVLAAGWDGAAKTRVATAAVAHFRWGYIDETPVRAVTMATFFVGTFIAVAQVRQILREEPSIARRLFGMVSLFATVASIALLFSDCAKYQTKATETTNELRALGLLGRAGKSRRSVIVSALAALVASAAARPPAPGMIPLEIASAAAGVLSTLGSRFLLYLAPAWYLGTGGRLAQRAFQAAISSVVHSFGPLHGTAVPALGATLVACLATQLLRSRARDRARLIAVAGASAVAVAAYQLVVLPANAELAAQVAGNGMSTALRPTPERFAAIGRLVAGYAAASTALLVVALAAGRGKGVTSLREAADRAERSPWNQVGTVDPVTLARIATMQQQAQQREAGGRLDAGVRRRRPASGAAVASDAAAAKQR